MLEILLDQRHRSGIPADHRRPYAVVILTQSVAGAGDNGAVADVPRQIHGALASLGQDERDRRKPAGA